MIINTEKTRECTANTHGKTYQAWTEVVFPVCELTEFTVGTETGDDTLVTDYEEPKPTSAAIHFALVRPNLFQVALAQTCFIVY